MQLYSGTSLAVHCETICGLLAELLLEARLQNVKNVLVEKATRFSDEPADVAVLLQYLRSLGVSVYSAKEQLELTADAGIENLLANISEEQIRSARVRLGRLKAAITLLRSREKTGRKPFGVLPGEDQALRRLLTLFRTRRFHSGRPRRTFQQIADILNNEGHRTRTGVAWTPGVVRRILVSLGKHQYFKTRTRKPR